MELNRSDEITFKSKMWATPSQMQGNAMKLQKAISDFEHDPKIGVYVPGPDGGGSKMPMFGERPYEVITTIRELK